MYDAQVWSYNHTSALVISYKDWRLHKVLVSRTSKNGVWEIFGKEKITGRNLKECLNQKFGEVNMDDIGHVLPCTPAMCIGSGGREFFNIVVTHPRGLMVESFLWEAQGVERRIALVPYTRGGGFVVPLGRYSSACLYLWA